MIPRLKEFLFTKHILVNETGSNREACFPTLFALAGTMGIRITEGADLAVPEMIRFAAEQIGQYIPEPFYRGFPESVRKLSPEERLYDQLASYALTYGLNDFSQARHSLFEEPFERIAFQEDAEMTEFRILEEEAAVRELDAMADSLLASSRQLSTWQLDMLCDVIREYGKKADRCGSKDTASKLLIRFRDPYYASFLRLPDVIRLVENMNYEENGSDSIKKLNLPNRQRKFIKGVLDILLAGPVTEKDIRDCFEKRAAWKGLLHHIHYLPATETGRRFVDEIRNAKGNCSARAAFEKEMAAGEPLRAAQVLKELKGGGAVTRNLNYILSRCKTWEEADSVLASLGKISPILSLQMLIQYKSYTADRRVFKFTRFNKLTKHAETEEEQERRRSSVAPEVRRQVVEYLRKNLRERLSENKIGKIYLDEAMKKVALPLQEAASSAGLGVLPKGTRLPMPKGGKLRCFTYWEKVNDIDLSCFGITDCGEGIEFSWRTAFSRTGNRAIVYSGDQTSGYHGGSEYFDIDMEAFREEYPQVSCIVFADNVYSDLNFSECFCKAGYMIREREDSGEVFEPKTVRTSFLINAKSRYAVLFALDLETEEIVWLNLGMNSSRNVAGTDQIGFVLTYMNIVNDANVYNLFEAKATELVSQPEEADLIVSDRKIDHLREDQEQIHSYDFEKILKYLNQ